MACCFGAFFPSQTRGQRGRDSDHNERSVQGEQAQAEHGLQEAQGLQGRQGEQVQGEQWAQRDGDQGAQGEVQAEQQGSPPSTHTDPGPGASASDSACAPAPAPPYSETGSTCPAETNTSPSLRATGIQQPAMAHRLSTQAPAAPVAQPAGAQQAIPGPAESRYANTSASTNGPPPLAANATTAPGDLAAAALALAAAGAGARGGSERGGGGFSRPPPLSLAGLREGHAPGSGAGAGAQGAGEGKQRVGPRPLLVPASGVLGSGLTMEGLSVGLGGGGKEPESDSGREEEEGRGGREGVGGEKGGGWDKGRREPPAGGPFGTSLFFATTSITTPTGSCTTATWPSTSAHPTSAPHSGGSAGSSPLTPSMTSAPGHPHRPIAGGFRSASLGTVEVREPLGGHPLSLYSGDPLTTLTPLTPLSGSSPPKHTLTPFLDRARTPSSHSPTCSPVQSPHSHIAQSVRTHNAHPHSPLSHAQTPHSRSLSSSSCAGAPPVAPVHPQLRASPCPSPSPGRRASVSAGAALLGFPAETGAQAGALPGQLIGGETRLREVGGGVSAPLSALTPSLRLSGRSCSATSSASLSSLGACQPFSGPPQPLPSPSSPESSPHPPSSSSPKPCVTSVRGGLAPRSPVPSSQGATVSSQAARLSAPAPLPASMPAGAALCAGSFVATSSCSSASSSSSTSLAPHTPSTLPSPSPSPSHFPSASPSCTKLTISPSPSPTHSSPSTPRAGPCRPPSPPLHRHTQGSPRPPNLTQQGAMHQGDAHQATPQMPHQPQPGDGSRRAVVASHVCSAGSLPVVSGAQAEVGPAVVHPPRTPPSQQPRNAPLSPVHEAAMGTPPAAPSPGPLGRMHQGLPVLQSASSGGLQGFSLEELQLATDQFAAGGLLGVGGFGGVYRGCMFCRERGRPVPVAVKVLNTSGNQGHKEWLTEVALLARLAHPCLVPLLGFCAEGEHRLLVYPFLPGGSLERSLFGPMLQARGALAHAPSPAPPPAPPSASAATADKSTNTNTSTGTSTRTTGPGGYTGGMQSNSSGSGSGGEAGAGRHGEGPAPGVPAALGWQEDSPQPLSRESGGNGGESGPPGGGVRLLGWLQRVQVAVQACRGLKYLHEEAEHKVIYRDFKTSNVLLDAEGNALLSDFGLARDGTEGEQSHVTTRVVGTVGYAAPEYVMTGHLSTRSDVWSFGVVLLELLTGRPALDKSRPVDEQSLVDWALPFVERPSTLYRVMDPALGGMYSVKGAQLMAGVVRQCLLKRPRERPKMSHVLDSLLPALRFQDCAGFTPAPSLGSPGPFHTPPLTPSHTHAPTPTLPLTPSYASTPSRTPRPSHSGRHTGSPGRAVAGFPGEGYGYATDAEAAGNGEGDTQQPGVGKKHMKLGARYTRGCTGGGGLGVLGGSGRERGRDKERGGESENDLGLAQRSLPSPGVPQVPLRPRRELKCLKLPMRHLNLAQAYYQQQQQQQQQQKRHQQLLRRGPDGLEAGEEEDEEEQEAALYLRYAVEQGRWSRGSRDKGDKAERDRERDVQHKLTPHTPTHAHTPTHTHTPTHVHTPTHAPSPTHAHAPTAFLALTSSASSSSSGSSTVHGRHGPSSGSSSSRRHGSGFTIGTAIGVGMGIGGGNGSGGRSERSQGVSPPGKGIPSLSPLLSSRAPQQPWPSPRATWQFKDASPCSPAPHSPLQPQPQSQVTSPQPQSQVTSPQLASPPPPSSGRPTAPNPRHRSLLAATSGSRHSHWSPSGPTPVTSHKSPGASHKVHLGETASKSLRETSQRTLVHPGGTTSKSWKEREREGPPPLLLSPASPLLRIQPGSPLHKIQPGEPEDGSRSTSHAPRSSSHSSGHSASRSSSHSSSHSASRSSGHNSSHHASSHPFHNVSSKPQTPPSPHPFCASPSPSSASSHKTHSHGGGARGGPGSVTSHKSPRGGGGAKGSPPLGLVAKRRALGGGVRIVVGGEPEPRSPPGAGGGHHVVVLEDRWNQLIST